MLPPLKYFRAQQETPEITSFWRSKFLARSCCNSILQGNSFPATTFPSSSINHNSSRSNSSSSHYNSNHSNSNSSSSCPGNGSGMSTLHWTDSNQWNGINSTTTTSSITISNSITNNNNINSILLTGISLSPRS